jgi:hypothetical protein
MSKASLPKKILNSPSVSKQAEYVSKLLDRGDSGGGSIGDEPRVPKGSPDGGQWTKDGGSTSAARQDKPVSQAAEQVLAQLDTVTSDAQPYKPNEAKPSKWKLSDRDKNYLDQYYPEIARLSKEHGVNPGFMAALGAESGYATDGTFKRTHDAFGLTGGSTDHMTYPKSPEDNVRRLFELYGKQIRGVGNDKAAFINAMHGKDRDGKPVPGWKDYNSRKAAVWLNMMNKNIPQMEKDLSIYLSLKKK